MQLEQVNNVLDLKDLFEKTTQNQVSFIDLIFQLNNTNIKSNRLQISQRKLNTTLKKSLLCKEIYDYNIKIKDTNLTISDLNKILTSYKTNQCLKNNLKSPISNEKDNFVYSRDKDVTHDEYFSR